MSKLTKNLITLGVMVMFICLPVFAFAQGGSGIDQVPVVDGLGDADIETTVINIINLVLSFLGLIALVIILLGGFKWMTSGGSEDKIGEAKKLMGAGIVGILIIFLAWAIANFVVTELVSVTS